jgi:hypothetical protein
MGVALSKDNQTSLGNGMYTLRQQSTMLGGDAVWDVQRISDSKQFSGRLYSDYNHFATELAIMRHLKPKGPHACLLLGTH